MVRLAPDESVRLLHSLPEVLITGLFATFEIVIEFPGPGTMAGAQFPGVFQSEPTKPVQETEVLKGLTIIVIVFDVAPVCFGLPDRWKIRHYCLNHRLR